MKKHKIFWMLFNLLVLIIAVYYSFKRCPIDMDLTKELPINDRIFFYIYVWLNIGFFILSYVFLFQKHTAVFLIGTVASIALANIAYLVIFNSSSEYVVMGIELYSIIIWPDLLLLLTKRIKFIFLSPVISIVLVFLIPDGMGAYWIAFYLTEFADVFLWTPIIWAIGALTIHSFSQESVKKQNEISEDAEK